MKTLFYIFLFLISISYLCFVIPAAALHPVKRKFAWGYLFTLLIFFVAAGSSNKRYIWLIIMLTILTVYNILIINRR